MNLVEDAIEEIECLILINKVVCKKYDNTKEIDKADKTRTMNGILTETINSLKEITDEPGRETKKT